MSNGWDGIDPVLQTEPGIDYELSERYAANNDINITGLRVWAGASSAAFAGRTGRVWTTGGSVLASVGMADSLSPGWSVFPLASQLPVANGTSFYVSYSTITNYGATPGLYPNPSADGAVTISEGRFNNSPGVFPNTPTTSFYGIDIVYNLAGNLPPVVTASATVDGLQTNVTTAVQDEFPATVVYGIEWGDGATSSGPGPLFSHVYAVPGTYVVLVTATDSGGLTDAYALVVTVHGGVSEEVLTNRRITTAFIAANPSLIVLLPRTRVLQANGGYRNQSGPPRASQIMRVIEQAPPSVVTLEDGTQRTLDYVLLAEWNAVLSKGDVFEFAGDTCRVIDVYHNNNYEIRADVIRQLDPPP